MTVFALWPGNHLAAHLMRNEVQAVADAKYRQAKRKHAVVCRRRVLVIHRRRASAQDNAGGLVTFYFIQRGRAGQDNGKNFQFTDAARNELRVLRTEGE